MKRLGLLGGVSAESTIIYYRLLNKAAKEHFGPQHGLELMLYALDYGVIIQHYDNRDWDAFVAEFVKGARALKDAAADGLIICSNTSHVSADAVAAATGLPVLHMLDALSDEMRAQNIRKPLLTGTPVVMSGDFYRGELARRYDGDVLIPEEDEQEIIGRIILDELVNGIVMEESRDAYLAVIDRWRTKGADAVILGCTELCMILDQSHTDLPVLDTTGLHAAAAARFALGGA